MMQRRSSSSRAVPAALTTLVMAMLGGCANLAPEYERPVAPLPAQAWQSPSPAGAVATPASDLPVQDFFTDARLLGVVNLALANNRDLRVAALNIDRARAQWGLTRSAELPTVNATGGASRARTSADTSASGNPGTGNTFSASIGLSAWEIDFFGRLRNLTQAAQETLLSTTETRRATQISLVADTATAWLTLAADQRRLALATQTLRSQQATYDLIERARALGAESGLTLAQARTTVEAARADVATYTRQVAQDRNALELLTGSAVPADLLPAAPSYASGATNPVAAAASTASLLVAVPEGLSSEVLQRRPDVLAAEYTLRGAYANIGAARAAFFPRISLTASAGSASRELDGLFGNGTGTWSFAPQIVLPIFNAGALQASLDVARITRDINIAQYEKTLQTAFREVADALAARATVNEQLEAQRALVDASGKALELSQARFRAGSDSFLDVQVSQRSFYTAGQGLISYELAEQVNRITLYKVLGGG
ncbi:efflux transporter outer membrane subunit [Variovorax sp. VNK109]|jgi:multidrug efflux system outer membrane protein|uniref:efflux transporter outer membrane subunit n=1 Tax=Variovorax sp. VNK109 TaxID=3400919 RepID=UPI003C031294